MIACVDVDYREDEAPAHAAAACVVIERWASADSTAEHVQRIDAIAPYVPGQLYLRELPCLLSVLEQVEHPLTLVVVDGYALLDAHGRPGLGAHLHRALQERIPVVGVAKNFFHQSAAIEVHRGGSTRPLYVTAVGIDPQAAAAGVAQMHGPHRHPTMLKRVDRLCRDAFR